MSIAFIDTPETHRKLLPLTYTRPSCGLRVGILTIREKWERFLGPVAGYFTEAYLSQKYPRPENFEYLIAGNVLPDESLTQALCSLKEGEAIFHEDRFIGAKSSGNPNPDTYKKVQYNDKIISIERAWDIFLKNGEQIRKDYELVTMDRHTFGLTDKHSRCYGNEIFVEEGATIRAAILNAEEGPIYIGKNARIHEGAIIKGPFALCDSSHINMGAKIRGDSTIGPHSKVGGEISNSVIQGYSNKAHDGFLGNAVIGEWCNLGADTNNSNLKNNYANVKMWDYDSGRFTDTGLQFCGLIMGDHSKCGINTMFNTGTTIGIASNIYGAGFPRNVIPSFSWGGAGGFVTHQVKKAIQTAELVVKRRSIELTEADKSILQYIFDHTSDERVWEKQDHS